MLATADVAIRLPGTAPMLLMMRARLQVREHCGEQPPGHRAPLIPEPPDGGGACDDGVMFRAPQVNFYVGAIGACAGFYRDVLGFTETFRIPEQGTPA
jgi:hypothetical protein